MNRRTANYLSIAVSLVMLSTSIYVGTRLYSYNEKTARQKSETEVVSNSEYQPEMPVHKEEFSANTDNNQPKNTSRNANPNHTKPLERIAENNAEDKKYMQLGLIKFHKDSDKLYTAKLLGHPQYNMTLIHQQNASMMNFDYSLITFQLKNEKISLLCTLPISYSAGSNYKVEFWRMVAGQAMDEEMLLNSYIKNMDPSMKAYTVAHSRPIDSNIEGIVIKMETIPK